MASEVSKDTVSASSEAVERLEARIWLARPCGSIVSCEIADLETLISTLRAQAEALEKAAAAARRYAACYAEGSDGRNTFLMLADHIAALTPEVKS